MNEEIIITSSRQDFRHYHLQPKNKYDRKDCLEIGLRAEEIFKDIMQEKGFIPLKANFYENVYYHWDYRFVKKNVSFTVDVKSKKRVSRKDKYTQSKLVWIELHSVRKNNRGWLYEGTADYIAFQLEKEFIVVPRLELIKLVEKIVDMEDIVSSSVDALYSVYKRKGRHDKLTLIEADDLKEITHRIINYG